MMYKTLVALALLGTSTLAIAAAPPPNPAPVGGEHSTISVHEGTSMAVSVSPDGKTLAIDLQGTLWTLPAKGGVARRITDYFNDARQPVWTPDGKSLIFFSYRSGNYDLWAIAPDGSDMRQITSGVGDDRDPAISPDGRFVAFASDRAGNGPPAYHIWTLDLATGALRQITAGGDEDRMPTWSPDGLQLAFSRQKGPSGAATIMAIPIRGGAEQLVQGGKSRLDAPSWSPDGTLAYISGDPDASKLMFAGKSISGEENVFPFRVSWARSGAYYYVADGVIHHAAKGGRTNIVPFTAALEITVPHYTRAKRDFDSTAPRKALGITHPTLSPDGRSIAFIALGDLYTVPVTGGVPTNLTHDHAQDADPAWSPDGTKLAYTSDKGGGLPQLWVRDLKTGKASQITTMDTQPLGAVWSPDGKRIAFIDADGRWGVAGLCVIEVATGKITRLHDSLPQPGEPSWSADGLHIALPLSKLYSKSFREGTNQVAVFRADSLSEPVWQVSDADVSIDTRGGAGPSWSPDGTKMTAIYDGLLKVWPVAPDGTPLGPPRPLTSEMSHHPTWAGNSRTILYQALDKLKTIDIDTGAIAEVPLNLTYTLAKPTGRTIIHVSGLVDAVTDATQTDKDIVIDGNRIVAIRPHNSAPLPAGTTYIEGKGLTAIPGLIDHHAHAQKDFGAAGFRSWLAYGITTVRDPGNQLYDGIENREALEAGVLIGPRLYVAGPLLEWQRVFYKMGIAVSGPAHLERELDLARALHYDMLKSYVRMTDFGQRRIVQAAHEMGVPVSSHEIYPAAYSGLDNTEHMGATSRRGYSPKQGPQARSYEDVIDLMGQTHRTITPTLFGALTGYLAQNPSYKIDPRALLYPKWAQESITSDEIPAALIKPIVEGSMKGMKDVYDAGALVTAGTDTPIAINLHAEIATYVRAGLTPFQALQTATRNPAKALNLDAGTLEVGKLADIVLIQGDPRENISATFNVRKVIANGVVFDESELLKGPLD